MAIGRHFSELLARLRRGGGDPDRDRLAAILALNRELAKAGDLRSLLTALLDEAVALFGAERGFVVAAGGDGLRVEAARSLDKETLRQPDRKISRTIVQQCTAERRGVFCADAREGDFGAVQSVADLKLRSVLCMPLLAGEACVGVIYLDHRFQSGAFSADDLPWLQAFADQAAIAVRLHRLLADNRAAAAELARRRAELEQQVAVQPAAPPAAVDESSRATLRHPYAEIHGESPALVAFLHRLDRVVAGDFPVLLQGESGVGKELAVRALHAHGRRAAGPLRAVNVAAITPELLDSELFGHRRGAFTGADRDRRGLIREADRGLLFLDEVSELRLDLQAKLLRFLEDRRVRPVGGDAEHSVDLRVVAACNRTLRQEVAAGRFREDLYYRLAVVTVEIPPLRERRGDIAALAQHVLEQAAAAAGRPPRRLDRACLAAMEQRPWPGNVRELRNVVLGMDALATGEVIGVELLPGATELPAEAETFDLAEHERRTIEAALRRTGGNKTAAARLLGISRRTLYDKLR